MQDILEGKAGGGSSTIASGLGQPFSGLLLYLLYVADSVVDLAGYLLL